MDRWAALAFGPVLDPQNPWGREPAQSATTTRRRLAPSYDDAPHTIQLWLDAGADTVDLVLPLGLPEGQLTEMLEAAAPAATR